MDSESSSLSSYWSGSSVSSEDEYIKKISTGNSTPITVQTGTAEAVRDVLRNRLKEEGRVVRDPAMMARRLRLESVDEAFVESCKAACLEERDEQLRILENLSLKAKAPRL
ncbi:hypothetical protein BDN71DRAFT_1453458 [Pleurotus eryngii]|uniref:Uncharacterized protein n=1 Tax=Pleurotus eryngii TaxID=5323 RepID=A0A9P6D3H1_PLEER|nr:hypothetical protein BDN71DRAFT_1453458 [Pleurotus eryngii]